jgi:hypothetical protein
VWLIKSSGSQLSWKKTAKQLMLHFVKNYSTKAFGRDPKLKIV